MNKRLRKKTCVGEFQELGFEVRADLRPGLTEAEVDAFMVRMFAVIEHRDLAFGGARGDSNLDGVVTRFGRGSATQDDRAALVTFLASDAAVVSHVVGELRDAWHGWA